jgi:hypothetical protein
LNRLSALMDGNDGLQPHAPDLCVPIVEGANGLGMVHDKGKWSVSRARKGRGMIEPRHVAERIVGRVDRRTKPDGEGSEGVAGWEAAEVGLVEGDETGNDHAKTRRRQDGRFILRGC